MVAMGVATILQSLRYRPIGSGFLCPERLGLSYFSVSLLASKPGGLSLVAGMTIVSGLFGVLLSRVARHLRPFFPTEVTGTIIMMVAWSSSHDRPHGS
jgi:xanthine/uracil permease